MTERQNPERIKHTFQPVEVCLGCYWEERYIKLGKLHKKLQLELTRATVKRRRRTADPAPERDEEETETSGAPEDVVDSLQLPR